MTRDPRHDILFEPLKIGPLTAKNRFFQVPHCNGMGSVYPSSMAAMRAMKAEGGWAVICTEETDIHPTSDITPIIEGRLWDDRDIPAFARMNDAVHAHGALAGIELVHTALLDETLSQRRTHCPNSCSRATRVRKLSTGGSGRRFASRLVCRNRRGQRKADPCNS